MLNLNLKGHLLKQEKKDGYWGHLFALPHLVCKDGIDCSLGVCSGVEGHVSLECESGGNGGRGRERESHCFEWVDATAGSLRWRGERHKKEEKGAGTARLQSAQVACVLAHGQWSGTGETRIAAPRKATVFPGTSVTGAAQCCQQIIIGYQHLSND